MGMPIINDLNAQLQGTLGLAFGSERRFGQFLTDVERWGPLPITIEKLAKVISEYPTAGAAPSAGAQFPSPQGVRGGLTELGTDWSRAILPRLEEAVSKWPGVAESHKDVLDRIKSALR